MPPHIGRSGKSGTDAGSRPELSPQNVIHHGMAGGAYGMVPAARGLVRQVAVPAAQVLFVDEPGESVRSVSVASPRKLVPLAPPGKRNNRESIQMQGI